MSSPLRKKRIWTIADVAAHAGLSHGQAKRLLKRLDKKHGGRLLIPSSGANREYMLFPAALFRLEPDLFAPLEDLEPRIEELEELLSEFCANQKRIAAQVGNHTRAIARISSVIAVAKLPARRRAA